MKLVRFEGEALMNNKRWPAAIAALAVLCSASSGAAARAQDATRPIDAARLAGAGIRKLSGHRITLYSDLPAGKEVDVLCQVFDQAYPQWCAYFHAPEVAAPTWQATVYLMHDAEKFRTLGLWREGIPESKKTGYAFNNE